MQTHPYKLKNVVSALALVAVLSLSACSPEPGTPDNGSSNPSGTVAPDSGDSGSSAAVGGDEAGKIATDKYGGTVKSVESDHWNGKDSWEVEIRDSDQGRIEVRVEKATGNILHMEKD